MLTGDADFGVRTNQFGFNLNWASSEASVVVEASTDLINWQPVQTNTLTTGSAYFSDPQWTNYPGRFYRLRSPLGYEWFQSDHKTFNNRVGRVCVPS